jgi:hypothetical protein
MVKTVREILTDLYLSAYEDGEAGNPAVFADMAVSEAEGSVRQLISGIVRLTWNKSAEGWNGEHPLIDENGNVAEQIVTQVMKELR